MKALPVLLLPPLLALGVLIFASGQMPDPAPLPTRAGDLACSQPPVFRVGNAPEGSGLDLRRGRYDFWDLEWLTSDVCSPGTLTLTASGTVVAGEAPQLEVAVDSHPISRPLVNGTQTLQVRIPQAGRITLAYLNPYDHVEAREAMLENVRFRGQECRTFDLHVPVGSRWDDATASTKLLTGEAMVITPCSSGTLLLKVFGAAAKGDFPMLRFEQGGREIRLVRTGTKQQALQLAVTHGPIKIVLTNPYMQRLAHRDLSVSGVTFTPDATTAP